MNTLNGSTVASKGDVHVEKYLFFWLEKGKLIKTSCGA